MIFKHYTKRNSLFILILLLFAAFLPILMILNPFSLGSNTMENIKANPSKFKNLEQTEVIGQISGDGSSRNSLISTNISETLLNKDAVNDFSIYTSNWNVSYTKLG
ncbi:MAG: hypothetical protein LUQ65_05270, partial [Candidatus Helarchaeota archaeon]|nr:hypothetical protein [Candidatus Helarchaeota archaeon]